MAHKNGTRKVTKGSQMYYGYTFCDSQQIHSLLILTNTADHRRSNFLLLLIQENIDRTPSRFSLMYEDEAPLMFLPLANEEVNLWQMQMAYIKCDLTEQMTHYLKIILAYLILSYFFLNRKNFSR